MPINLDVNLPPSLYPLAWIMGRWEGKGGVTLHEEDGSSTGRLIEQTLVCAANDDGTMSWSARTEMVDSPAPLPPTSVFVGQNDAPAPEASGSLERTLLMKEKGTWRVGDPLPGQDVEAARRAKPGSPESIISYAVTATFETANGPVEWVGEIRGPRIRLAQVPGQEAVAGVERAERMFGYVGGRLMWLWERSLGGDAEQELAPFISLEMDRAAE